MNSLKYHWVLREGDIGRPISHMHFVESEIVDRVVTSCGRQMHRVTSTGSLVRVEPGGAYTTRRCYRCHAVRVP